MEDSGGAYGFAQIMEVLKGPSHPGYREISDWVRSTWWSPLNAERINLRIKNIYRHPILHGDNTEYVSRNDLIRCFLELAFLLKLYDILSLKQQENAA